MFWGVNGCRSHGISLISWASIALTTIENSVELFKGMGWMRSRYNHLMSVVKVVPLVRVYCLFHST